MPALPPVAGVILVKMHIQVSEDTRAINRFYIHYSGTAPTDVQLTAFAASINTAWAADMVNMYSSARCQLILVECIDLTSATGAYGANSVIVVGTRAGTAMAAATSLILQQKILRRYRGGHPRQYLSVGVVSDLADSQTWVSSFANAVASNYVTFMNAILAAGWTGAGTLTSVNVSYYSGFTVVTNPITHRARNVPTLRVTPVVDTILAFQANIRPGVQRRRGLQSA